MAAGWALAGAVAAAVVPAALAAAEASADRARAGDFDATGPVACAMNPGQAMASCTAHVARGDGDGEATAVVAFGNGFRRTLFFEGGAFVAGDATMSGTGRDTDWQARDGMHLIRVDDQRFEIPDTLLFGE